MEKDQQTQLETGLELDFAVLVPNVASFRVNAFHQIKGLAAVFRVIPDAVPTLEELNLRRSLKKYWSCRTV